MLMLRNSEYLQRGIMRRVELTVSFTDERGAVRLESQRVDSSYTPDPDGEHRVAHILSTELKVTIGEQAAPRHNATARGWLDFPNQPAGFDQFLNIQNSQAMWFELARLVMGAEADLALSLAFKALEPALEPPFEDSRAINDLYYVHDRKLALLNQTVYALIKVQDLVNRLLHESLGGDLVDSTKPDWERTELTRRNVKAGFEAKLAAGTITQGDFDAITQALAIPGNTPRAETARTYRNRLMHHVRPSVDYAMFFSALESRQGEEFRDTQGKLVGRRHILRARPAVQHHFHDLHAAFSEHLDAVASMLDQLSQIAILRR
jgi:hypothetical protein